MGCTSSRSQEPPLLLPPALPPPSDSSDSPTKPIEEAVPLDAADVAIAALEEDVGALLVRVASDDVNFAMDVAAAYHKLGMAFQEKALKEARADLVTCKCVQRDAPPNIIYTIGMTTHRVAFRDLVPRAMEYFDKSLHSLIAARGETHPDVASYYQTVAAALAQVGANTRAIAFLQEALRIARASVGNEHATVGTSYRSLGDAYARALNENHLRNAYDNIMCYSIGTDEEILDLASDNYTKALRVLESAFGEASADVAECHFGLGQVLFAKRDLDRSMQHVRKAVETATAVLGPTHARTTDFASRLEELQARNSAC